MIATVQSNAGPRHKLSAVACASFCSVAAAQLQFDPPVIYPVGSAPSAVIAIDFDGDDSLDLAIADFGNGTMWIVLNKGGLGVNWLGFETPAGYPRGGDRPHAIAAGDLDNDGDPDIVITNVGSVSISVMWNDGNARFNDVNIILPGNFSPASIITHDLDNDGDIDLATANMNTVSVVINHGPCYADCDLSAGIGTLDIFDFLCFQSSFVASRSYACDCDLTTGRSVYDIFDFICFQSHS